MRHGWLILFALASGIFGVVAGGKLAFGQDYIAPDADLWRQMTTAIATVPMSLTAHQQVQTILNDALNEARVRALRAKVGEQTKDEKKP